MDIHPSGSKLATAGQDGGGAGLLIVWDLEFLNLSINESTEVMPLFNNYPMARIPHSSIFFLFFVLVRDFCIYFLFVDFL